MKNINNLKINAAAIDACEAQVAHEMTIMDGAAGGAFLCFGIALTLVFVYMFIFRNDWEEDNERTPKLYWASLIAVGCGACYLYWRAFHLLIE